MLSTSQLRQTAHTQHSTPSQPPELQDPMVLMQHLRPKIHSCNHTALLFQPAKAGDLQKAGLIAACGPVGWHRDSWAY